MIKLYSPLSILDYWVINYQSQFLNRDHNWKFLIMMQMPCTDIKGICLHVCPARPSLTSNWAENWPQSQWEKVINFPNFMLKHYQLHLHFDLKRLSQDHFSKAIFRREKTLNFWITENLKEYTGFVPHLKDVHFFPISQNVDNFPNSERSSRPCPNKGYVAVMYSE